MSRIEGQVRGIRAMVQDERYCPDILVQVSAVQSALNGFCKVLLSYQNLCGGRYPEWE